MQKLVYAYKAYTYFYYRYLILRICKVKIIIKEDWCDEKSIR